MANLVKKIPENTQKQPFSGETRHVHPNKALNPLIMLIPILNSKKYNKFGLKKP